MGRTIIQPIGPLYGEAVNGTVFGRPNGSIYVPPTNTIKLSINGEYIVNGSGQFASWIYPATDAGVIISGAVSLIAESQDTAAYMAVQLSDDSDFTTYDETSFTAGSFNISRSAIIQYGTITVSDGTTYYARAVLYAASGVAVAYSDTITLTGVAE